MSGKPMDDLLGENCYKLKVIEYYFDNSEIGTDMKKKNFRITFQIDDIINCDGTSDNVNNIDQNYKDIEIDLKIPRKDNQYTGTIENDDEYVITAIDTNGNNKQNMLLKIIDQKKDQFNRIFETNETDKRSGLAKYFDQIKHKERSDKYIKLDMLFDPYQLDRFRRRTYDGNNDIPDHKERLEEFNKISDNYYVIGQFKKIDKIDRIGPGGAPSRKSRRTRKSRKAHKSKKSGRKAHKSKKSGRKSRRNSRR